MKWKWMLQESVLSQASETYSDVESFRPVKIDSAALESLLTSYTLQHGHPGPASTLLNHLKRSRRLSATKEDEDSNWRKWLTSNVNYFPPLFFNSVFCPPLHITWWSDINLLLFTKRSPSIFKSIFLYRNLVLIPVTFNFDILLEASRCYSSVIHTRWWWFVWRSNFFNSSK